MEHGEGIREDDHLGVNGPHVVHESTGCCPQCFCFRLVIGGVFFSRDGVVNGPDDGLMNIQPPPFLVAPSAELSVDPLRDVFHDIVNEDDEQRGRKYTAPWHAFFQSLLPASVLLILHSSLPVGEVLTYPAVYVSLDSTLVHLQFQAALPDLVKDFSRSIQTARVCFLYGGLSAPL